MISDRVSAIGPVWDAKSVKDKIKAMKIAVKKKYSARFEADGSEKAPGEYEALTPIEEKFCARVRVLNCKRRAAQKLYRKWSNMGKNVKESPKM